MAAVTEIATGFPGYNCMMPKEKAAIGAILQQYGYNTFCLGKHLNFNDLKRALNELYQKSINFKSTIFILMTEG